MNVKPILTQSYERHGCNLYGNLAIFEYWENLRKHNETLALSGFGQLNHQDFVNDIKNYLKTNGIKYKRLLTIPDFVIRVNDADYEKLKIASLQ